MAATIKERQKSPRLSEDDKGGGSGEATYDIFAATDHAEAMTLLKATAPAALGTLYRKSVEVAPIGRNYAGEWYEGRATYGPLESPGDTSGTVGEPGGGRVSFRIGLTSHHVTQAKETPWQRHDPAFFTSPPDLFGGINPVRHGDGNITYEGCDILVPEASWEETFTALNTQITASYRLAALRTVGKVNDAPFRGTQKGETLFLGLSGSLVTGGAWELTYNFAFKENFEEVPIGPVIKMTGEGWFYVSILRCSKVDGGTLIQVPGAAYCHRVYDYADFSQLGIGVD